MAGIPWSAEDLATLRVRWARLDSVYSIADDLGRSDKAIYHAARRLGLRRWHPEQGPCDAPA